MGRVITFSIKKANGGNFTEKELQTIINIDRKYTTGKFADVWSCETMDINPYKYYVSPFSKKGKLLNSVFGERTDEIVAEAIKKLTDGKSVTLPKNINAQTLNTKLKKYTLAEAIALLVKQEYLTSSQDTGKEVSGFVKVQGNEFNALIIFQALKEISILIPSAEIYMADDGEFLFVPLRLRNGLALPLITDLKDDIQSYAMLMLFSEGFDGNILNKLKFKAEDFSHETKMNFNIKNSYGDMTQSINDKLRNLKEIEDRVYKLVDDDGYGGKREFYLEAFEKRDCKKWFPAELMTRMNQINPTDFERFITSPSTIMAGFEGEYYGINSKDAEAESYRAIGRIQKMFGGMGELEILGEKKI